MRATLEHRVGVTVLAHTNHCHLIQNVSCIKLNNSGISNQILTETRPINTSNIFDNQMISVSKLNSFSLSINSARQPWLN